MTDNKMRYYYIVKKDNDIIYEGFMLHDEAWCLTNLKIPYNERLSLINTKKVSNKTDSSFFEFLKSVKG
jgi:hypothetical protein